MSKFTKGTWKYAPVAGNVVEFTGNDEHIEEKIIALLNPSIEKNTRELIGRLIAAAPDIYELLREELIPTSDYGGIVNFERKCKVKELLAQIDEEAEMTEEIKPCPFCGGEGRIFEDTSFGWDNPLYHVFCGMCLARTDTAYHREDAIEIWNGRVNDDKGKDA